MRPTSLQTFALVLGCSALGCSGPDATAPLPYDGPVETGGTSSVSANTGGTGASGDASGSSGMTTGGVTIGSSSTTDSTTSGTTVGGSTTGGDGTGGATGGSTTSVDGSGTTVGGSTTAGDGSGGATSGGATTGGFTNGGFTNNSSTTGGSTTGGNGAGGATSGGSTTGGSTTGGSTEIDCNAQMPSGGQQHSGNSQGGSGNLAWQIWSNVGSGTLTTFSTPAFSAGWNNSGDYLGRLGFEWGNSAEPYTAHGTIIAQYASTKTGSGGGYSYIGMYGWTTNPCVEWYIVDDSFNNMPVNPGNTTNKGTIDVDGGSYVVYTRNTSGTGGSRCSGVSNWIQYYSVRTEARECGQITLTDHFDAWNGMGMSMGNLLEAKILVEVGGGSGSVDFPIANVTTSQ